MGHLSLLCAMLQDDILCIRMEYLIVSVYIQWFAPLKDRPKTKILHVFL